MAATNTVAVRTGNVSAGTSIFAMVVLEKMLKNVYPEIDLVTTPDGAPVAMVHCNNCTSDLKRLGEPVWPGGGSVRHTSAGIPVVPAAFQCLAGGRTGLRRCGAGELLFRRGSDPL